MTYHPEIAIGPAIIGLSLFIATLYLIYRAIITSDWVDYRRRDARTKKAIQATQDRLNQAEQLNRNERQLKLAEWQTTDYRVPNREQFLADVFQDSSSLTKVFLSNILPKWTGKEEWSLLPIQQVKDIYAETVQRAKATILIVPEATRFAGTWIVAPPGRGKTNLLHNMIREDLKERCTVVLMDSKGDLINGYKGFSDVIVIDPATANINPLQLGSSTRSVEFLEYIFGSLLKTSMTALQKTLFRSVLTVLIRVPGATLETFRQILTVGWKPLEIEQYILQCDPATQDFFLTGKPPEFDNATYRETKQQILWRLRLILSNDYLRNIFTSPTTNVQFSELLDSGKTIIIDNSKDDLGEEGAEFFGRFFIALTWMAAVTRSRLRPEQKMPVYFYIDECQSVIKRDEKIATILDECRSQKIALILAHQRVAQITAPNVLDALGNCAIRIANSDEDAPSLAPRFRVEPAALRLPIGSFACFVRDKTAQAVTVTAPEFDLSTLPDPPPRNYHAPPPLPRPRPREETSVQSSNGNAPKAPLDFG